MNPHLRLIASVNFTVMLALAAWALLGPAVILVRDLGDPGLKDGSIPRLAFRRHAALGPRFADWARSRVVSGKAAELKKNDVAATEWPMFGSVFLLWTTEALQEAWLQDRSLASVEPARQAAEAIEAAADLVADPNHAAWVKAHWGNAYLDRQNLFYRMLLIGGLTSYQKLTGNARYRPLLESQVKSLSAELDASPHGLLEDYPGECYPIDIVPAIAVIRRADAVLGTDHGAFVSRAIRGFQGDATDPETGLPAYEVDSKSGKGVGPARGIGVSYILIWAPELWSEPVQEWYAAFDRSFWQDGLFLRGVREFARDHPAPDWSIDVDAGPVIGGFGTAASAFAIGATRANGRFDQAYPLAAEALAASWPLPDGSLLIPRILSNVAHSPYLGESALLFCLTRRPVAKGSIVPPSRGLPAFVYLMIAAYLGMGLLVTWSASRGLRRWLRGGSRWSVPLLRLQFGVWTILTIAGVLALVVVRPLTGLLLFLGAQLLPRLARLVESPAGPTDAPRLEDFANADPV